MKILVIPDAHATPYHNNKRFAVLGKYIVDEQPDIIVNIGDFGDMPSLSSYDKGKKSFEGRRYKHDVEAVIDAQKLIFEPLKAYNKLQRAAKRKQYKPKLILTLGNHEHRINRVSEISPELDETISVDDLKFKEFGWEVHDYGTPVFIEGIAFSHVFISGIMGRPISGEHHAHSLLIKMHHSCVQGHSHLRDFCERTTASGKKLLGLVVGCYLDTDQHEHYAGEANKLWWRGLVMLHNVKDGQFDPEFISMERLKEMYE